MSKRCRNCADLQLTADANDQLRARAERRLRTIERQLERAARGDRRRSAVRLALALLRRLSEEAS